MAPTSAAFKRWFKGSKVVDGKGKPLVVYHGTIADEDFSVFRTPAHFGTLDAASDILEFKPSTVNARILPAYLSIVYPLRAQEEDYDGLQSFSDFVEAAWDSGALTQTAYNKLNNPRSWFKYDTRNRRTNTNEDAKLAKQKYFAKSMKKSGYDGFVYQNMVEDAGIDSWVPLSPTQIKSIHNRGTFDPNDPIITNPRKNPMAKKKCGARKKLVYFPSTDTEVCFRTAKKHRKKKKSKAKKRVVRRVRVTTKTTYGKKKKAKAKSRKRAPDKPVTIPKGKKKGDHFTKKGKHYTVVSFIKNGKRIRYARKI